MRLWWRRAAPVQPHPCAGRDPHAVAHVIGADRTDRPSEADVFVNTTTKDLAEECKRATDGKGVDIIYDTVGGPLFEPCLKSLAPHGRQIAINSAGDRRVSFDLIDFYHQSLHLIGVDSMKFSGVEIAGMLNSLKPGFERGQLKPYEVQIWPLAAWQSVLPSGTLPPWSWTSTRHSSPRVSRPAKLTGGAANAAAAMSATPNPTVLEGPPLRS